MKRAMYHYLESGLRNVWLANGYREIDTPDGKAVAIEDVEGLHQAIGRDLLARRRLSGSEFRFLRKELGFSQKVAGQILGVSAQSVALWEKHGRIPGPAERLLRVAYQARAEAAPEILEALKRINELDRDIAERMNFALTKDGEEWKRAA